MIDEEKEKDREKSKKKIESETEKCGAKKERKRCIRRVNERGIDYNRERKREI